MPGTLRLPARLSKKFYGRRDVSSYGSRFSCNRSEIRRWSSVFGRGFIGRGNTEKCCFIERTRKKVDADGKFCRSPHKAGRRTVSHSIPHLGCEPRRHCHRGKSLLPQQRPSDG